MSGGPRIPLPPVGPVRRHWKKEANMINALIIAGSVAVAESAVFTVSFAVIRGVFDRTWKQLR
jgi:hypothetical protein